MKSRKWRLASGFLAACLVALVFGAVQAQAATTYTVDDDWQSGSSPYTEDTDGDTDFATIQKAIAAASPGDIINVAAGTYEEDVILITKALTIKGANYRTAAGSYVTMTTVKPASPHMAYLLSIYSCQDVFISWLTLDLAGRAVTAAVFWGYNDFNYSSLSDCRIQGEAGDTWGRNLYCVLEAYNGAEKVKFERNILDAEILGFDYAAGIGFYCAGDIIIKNNVINGHGTAGNGVVGLIYGPGYIEGNTITDCDNGIYQNQARLEIKDNVIYENNIGIFADPSWGCTIHENSIYENESYGVLAYPGSIDAEDN